MWDAGTDGGHSLIVATEDPKNRICRRQRYQSIEESPPSVSDGPPASHGVSSRLGASERQTAAGDRRRPRETDGDVRRRKQWADTDGDER